MLNQIGAPVEVLRLLIFKYLMHFEWDVHIPDNDRILSLIMNEHYS